MPDDSDPADTPLLRRFPRLSALPRARLGVVESPVERWDLDDVAFWVKRDDLNGPQPGGNKLRALEWLLGPRLAGDTVVTVGGVGSTHILATARHAARLGVRTLAFRWPHEANDLTGPISAAIEAGCAAAPVYADPVRAYAAAVWWLVRRGGEWVPFGGTSPLGMVGHVAAGLELGEQVRRGDLPEPAEVVVAHGTGGTAAGLALGVAAAGLTTRVIAVRCGPRTGVEGLRLSWLVRRLAGLLRSHGADVGRVAPASIQVEHSLYAGAYARPLPAAEALRARVAERLAVGLDATYSARACYAAAGRAREARGPVLFWQTFDARCLTGPHVANR